MMLPRRLTTKSHAHRGEREGPLLDVEGRKYHIKDSLEPGINIILDERKREHKKTDEQKEVEEDNDVEHVDSFSDIKIESNKYSRKNVAESENNTRYIETDFGKETKTLSQFLNQQKTNNLKMILPGGHEFQLLNEEGKHHSSRTMDKEDSNDEHEEGNETKKNKKEKLKTLDSFESFDKPDDDENEKAVKENKEDGENKIRGEDENAERKESKEKESETGKSQKDSKKEEKENDGKEKEEAPVIKEDKDDKEYRQQTSSDNDGDERESQTHYPSQSKPDDSRESFYEKNNGKYSGRKKISEKGSDMDTENFESEDKKHHRNDKNDMATNGKDSSKEKDIDKVKESGSTFHMGDAPGIIDHSQFLPHNVAQAEAPPIVDHSKFMAGDEGLAPEVEDHSNFITKNDRGTSAHKGTSRETDETPLSHKGTKQTERNHLNISRNHDAEQQYDTPHVDTYREGDELKSYKSDDHETADQKNMFSTWHHTESTHQSDRCGMTPCEMKNETHDVGHCSELQVGESNVCQPLTHLPTEYQEEPVPPASHVSCQELHCVGMSHPEEPMPSEKSAPHIKHKPDIIKVEFVPEEVTVVGNKTKASSPSGKIRVQFVPGEEIVEPKVSSEEVFARSSNDLTKDKINNDLEVGKHVKSVPSKKEENTFPDEPSNNEKSSPKFNEQPLHGNSKPPEDKPSAKSDSQEENIVGEVVLENGKLSAVHQSTQNEAYGKKKHKALNGYEAHPAFLPFGVKAKSSTSTPALPNTGQIEPGMDKHEPLPSTNLPLQKDGSIENSTKFNNKISFMDDKQHSEYHPFIEPEPREEDKSSKPLIDKVDDKSNLLYAKYFNEVHQKSHESERSYRETSSSAPVMRNEKDELVPHRFSKSINGYEVKPARPQMVDKKDTEKGLGSHQRESDAELADNLLDKIPQKHDMTLPPEHGGGGGGGVGGVGGRGGGGGGGGDGGEGGGGGPGGGISVPGLPSPDTDERVDPEFTSLGQQYPDAVPPEVKNAVNAMRANPAGGSDAKTLDPGADKLPADPDRVFMGGALPMGGGMSPQDTTFGGPIANPDPNPTQHAPTDLGAHNGIINPVVSHLVDAINDKAVSTEEALQMMNDFVSGNQDMSKAAKNVEGMLTQIQTQRRHSAPGATDPSLSLPDPPMMPPIAPPVDDGAPIYNPGDAGGDRQDSTHFFNPDSSILPSPNPGEPGLASPGLGLPGMEPPVNDKDATFFNPGNTVSSSIVPNRITSPPISKISRVSNLNQMSLSMPMMYQNRHTQQLAQAPIEHTHHEMFSNNGKAPVSFSERGEYVAQDLATGTLRRVGQQSDRDDEYHPSLMFESQRGDGRRIQSHRMQNLEGVLHSSFENFDSPDIHKSMSSSNQGSSFMSGKESGGMGSSEHSLLPSTDLMGNMDMQGNTGGNSRLDSLRGSSHMDNEMPSNHMERETSSDHIESEGPNGHMRHGKTAEDLGIPEYSEMHGHNSEMNFEQEPKLRHHEQIQSFINNRYDDNSEAELPTGHFMAGEYSGKSLGLPDTEVSSSFSRKFHTPHLSEHSHHNIETMKKTRIKSVGGSRKHNVIADMYADSIFPEDINDIDSLQGSLEGKTLTHFYKQRQESATRRSLRPENMQSIKASFPLQGSTTVADDLLNANVRSSVPRYGLKKKLHRKSKVMRVTKRRKTRIWKSKKKKLSK